MGLPLERAFVATYGIPMKDVFVSEDLAIGYNAQYLLDILRTMESDEVLLQLNTPVTAGLLIPAPSGETKTPPVENLLCLVMPLRLAS